jgi:hypothetical protein
VSASPSPGGDRAAERGKADHAADRGASGSRDELLDELTPGELVLRGFSVAPFLAIGVIGAIGIVASVTVVIFGAGPDVDALWTRMSGRSLGGALVVLLEAILLTAIPVGLVALAVVATNEGLRRRQRAWFWPVVIAVAVLVAVAVAVIQLVHGSWLGGTTTGVPDWVVLEIFAAFTAAVAVLRRRRQPRDMH